MTANQIEWAKLRESIRHNLADEALTAKQRRVQTGQLREDMRHNQAEEQINWYKATDESAYRQGNLGIGWQNAYTNARNADTNAAYLPIQWYTAEKNAEIGWYTAQNNAGIGWKNALSNAINAATAQARAAEDARHNAATEGEAYRHNVAMEGIESGNLGVKQQEAGTKQGELDLEEQKYGDVRTPTIIGKWINVVDSGWDTGKSIVSDLWSISPFGRVGQMMDDVKGSAGTLVKLLG